MIKYDTMLKGTSELAKTVFGATSSAAGLAAGLTGALALHTIGKGLQDAPKTVEKNRNALTKETFRNSGWFGKQSIVYTAGLASGNSVFGGFGALSTYNAARVKDTFSGYGKPHVLQGAAAGGGLGLLVGSAAAAFTKSASAIPFFAGAGVIGGAYTARKVGLQIQEGVNLARRSSLNRERFSNKGRGGGAGYRSWSNSRSMGKPGHLGMDGSVPFALHKIRGKSTV